MQLVRRKIGKFSRSCGALPEFAGPVHGYSKAKLPCTGNYRTESRGIDYEERT